MRLSQAASGSFALRSLGSDMDATDTKILMLLQEDASISIAELAQRVNLSQTPCWKRIQRLEATGVIEKRVALVDPEKVGLGLTVFGHRQVNGLTPQSPMETAGQKVAASPVTSAQVVKAHSRDLR